jgi:hypothetical protein
MRTKIIIQSTTAEQVLRALPNNFQGYVTVEADKRLDVNICWIYHTSPIDTKLIYHKLGIKLHHTHLLPQFLF